MITYDAENRLFHLKSRQFSYVIQVLDNRQLVHRYFGKKVSTFSENNKVTYLDRAFSGNPTLADRSYSLDTLPLEYSSNGLGDYRTSSIDIASSFGTALDLKYHSHIIYEGKKSLEGLPSSYGEEAAIDSLDIVLEDTLNDLTLTLSYNLFAEQNMLARSVKVRTGQYPIQLNKVYSFILDLPSSDWTIHTLTGRYAYEKAWTRTPLPKGKYEIGSIRGASSHSATPFIALASQDVTETSGEVYSAHLIYSGNFKAFAETSPIQTTRWGIGLNDDKFSWQLESYSSFQSPEAILSYTDLGLTDMTHTSQNFVRHHICRGSFSHKPRPILINNWEATYFDFTEKKIFELAQVAKEAGIELFVLDDGWFGQRDSDNSSLGDWFENKTKLPNGLDGLAKSITDLGMAFGLWVEPEMISENSELYRKHPDWAIQIKDRSHTYSRGQLVLNLAKKEVCDYVISAVSKILHSANISYVKWDMNRNITNIPEDYSNANRDEFFHRYILGLYRILEELQSAFPDVLFESCSGGGGRYDLGMLSYMPQTWTSDNTDAISRISIQEGTSLIFPAITMGAHVSAVPNHQVGRLTPMETRANMAMLGNLGYELDLTLLSSDDLKQITSQVRTYKKIRDTVQFGDYYRLQKTTNYAAYNYVNQDQTQVVFTFVKILSQPEAPLIQIKLKGLNPNFKYYSEELEAAFYGDELMNIGLTIPYVQKDYFSVQYIFHNI